MKFLNSRRKDVCRNGSDLDYTSFISDREWLLVDRGAVPLDFNVQSERLSLKHLDTNIMELCP